ncbi:hypothetical protein DYB28_009375 [Aphanomyces astaci]|uniref:Uncharacterized protein n=1 Tax=Aphanomyces astaci TaxID=112090 RepID=A0A9X8E711_APHAT|nr:hypothetical protein DYB28_009375 [Aphanomyces astaci]
MELTEILTSPWSENMHPRRMYVHFYDSWADHVQHFVQHFKVSLAGHGLIQMEADTESSYEADTESAVVVVAERSLLSRCELMGQWSRDDTAMAIELKYQAATRANSASPIVYALEQVVTSATVAGILYISNGIRGILKYIDIDPFKEFLLLLHLVDYPTKRTWSKQTLAVDTTLPPRNTKGYIHLAQCKSLESRDIGTLDISDGHDDETTIPVHVHGDWALLTSRWLVPAAAAGLPWVKLRAVELELKDDGAMAFHFRAYSTVEILPNYLYEVRHALER